jgi:hypothetical protein
MMGHPVRYSRRARPFVEGSRTTEPYFGQFSAWISTSGSNEHTSAQELSRSTLSQTYPRGGEKLKGNGVSIH